MGCYGLFPWSVTVKALNSVPLLKVVSICASLESMKITPKAGKKQITEANEISCKRDRSGNLSLIAYRFITYSEHSRRPPSSMKSVSLLKQ